MSRRVLVVGGNGGVGTAVTRKMVALGYHVVTTVSRPEKLANFECEVPGCAQVLALDLSCADHTAKVIGDVVSAMDRLDAVVVCSAVAPFAPAETTPLEMFRQTMEVNCISNLAIYKSVLPALRLTRGRLIIVSSYSGCVATPVMAAYVSSKFALEGLADVMRQEAGAWGVEVILLQPGIIDTPMVRRSRAALADTIPHLPAEEQALYGKLYRQMQYRAVSALEAGGMMPPETVADAAIHAIETADPLPRYPVGTDAKYLLDISRTKSDREMDSIILDIYHSTPVE